MKKLAFLPLFAALLLQVACGPDPEPDRNERIAQSDREIRDYLADNSIAAQPEPNEDPPLVYYRLLEERPQARLAVTGSIVTIDYTGRLFDGTFLDSSAAGEPLTFVQGYVNVLQGVDRGVGLMREGERADLFINAMAAYGANSNAQIPAYSPVRFDVTLLKVQSELEAIEAAIVADTNAAAAVRLSSGISYIPIDTGSGARAVDGQSVEVAYKGSRLINGCEFDQSSRFVFTVGAENIIEGFSAAVRELRPGGRARFYIPSDAAYRDRGTGTGNGCRPRPGDPLIFDITLKAIL
ncbi:MAG: FKBP-type peptidyl-prolyl cis-trans isomerase [Catalinimonas sp.]